TARTGRCPMKNTSSLAAATASAHGDHVVSASGPSLLPKALIPLLEAILNWTACSTTDSKNQVRFFLKAVWNSEANFSASWEARCLSMWGTSGCSASKHNKILSREK